MKMIRNKYDHLIIIRIMAFLFYESTNYLYLCRSYFIKFTGVLLKYFGLITRTINQLSTIVFLLSQGYRRWIRTYRMIRKLPFSYYKYVKWTYLKYYNQQMYSNVAQDKPNVHY